MFFEVRSEYRRIVQPYVMNNRSVLKPHWVSAKRNGHAIAERIDIWRS
jgi:hypothetical protein